MKKRLVIRCGNLYLTSMGWLDMKCHAEKYNSLPEGLWALLKTIAIFPRLEAIEPAAEKALAAPNKAIGPSVQ